MATDIIKYMSYLNKKFWQKVDIIEDDTSCWNWTKEKDKWGYGVVCIYEGTKKIKRICASRASWIIHHKQEVPEKMIICHHCDNRLCVRPSHLFLGTYKDNMQDCKNKNRLSKCDRKRKNPYKRIDSVKDRFLDKIEKQKNNCWIWNSSRDKNGYGVFLLNKKVRPAHRVSWTLFFGEIPKGMLVCHKCDNRLCVNPEHLFIGTPKDNAIDCSNKKRNIAQKNPNKTPRGENHGNAKLKNKEVKKMYDDFKLGLSRSSIVEKYGVKRATLNRILSGHSWNSVTNIKS